MHIIVLVLGVVAGLGFWWYRLRAAKDAAGEIVNVVGRVRGNIRRKRIRTQAEMSPLTAIDDPVVAAATILVAVASDDIALSPEREQVIRAEIGELTTSGKADEALVYAKWAAAQIDEAGTVLDKLAPFLAERLNGDEKHTMVAMAGKAMATRGDPLPLAPQRISRLTQKLGLEVH